VFLVHIALAIRTKLAAKGARPIAYQATSSRKVKTKGGNSHSSFASLNMIVSGAIVLAFLILHILQFSRRT
jgi:hypothetical protein